MDFSRSNQNPKKPASKGKKKEDQVLHVNKQLSRIGDESCEEIVLNTKSKQSHSSKLKRYDSISGTKSLNASNSKSSEEYLQQHVEIFSLERHRHSLSCFNSNNPRQNVFAHGTVIGNFYEASEAVKIESVCFIGNFDGIFSKESVIEDGQYVNKLLYFQGFIDSFRFLFYSDEQEKLKQSQEVCSIFQDATNFKGLFKGYFYDSQLISKHHSADILGMAMKMNPIVREHSNPLQGLLNIVRQSNPEMQAQPKMLTVQNSKNNEVMRKIEENMKQSEKNQRVVEFFLPTTVRAEIIDIREINLEKSMAMVHANIIIDIKYNQEVWKAVSNSKKKHQITLEFNRDVSMTLPLYEEEEDYDSDSDSSNSNWSLQDVSWDIDFYNNHTEKVWHFKLWKAFKTEIDITYGAFYAPFNISLLKIVMKIQDLEVKEPRKTTKLSFVVVDVNDFNEQKQYNPFCSFTALAGTSASAELVELRQQNRITKINRRLCEDIGEYIIADNYLRLFPYHKNVIRNTNTNSEDIWWSLARRKRVSLLEQPTALSLEASFDAYEKGGLEEFKMFHFHKWNYVQIQIPVYKYIAIGMIQVFIPLTILVIISLFIFNQENGEGSQNGGFTTLNERLANVAAMVFAYVSLIPVIRENLPPTPNVTFIEIMTYVEILPNFLAIANSMIYYSDTIDSWRGNYRIFNDALFVVSFCMSLLNLLLLILIFIAYKLRPFTIDAEQIQVQKRLDFSQARAPAYLKYINMLKQHRGEFEFRDVDNGVDDYLATNSFNKIRRIDSLQLERMT